MTRSSVSGDFHATPVATPGTGHNRRDFHSTRAMRLTSEQRRAIVTATAELAGAGARVRLFGSRLHDDVAGGDIDLLVECPSPVERPVRLETQLTARLQRVLGDRRIDVLVVDPTTPLAPVHHVARTEGVWLGHE